MHYVCTLEVIPLSLDVGRADEQETAAAEGAKEEEPPGVKGQCGRPRDGQVLVKYQLQQPRKVD